MLTIYAMTPNQQEKAENFVRYPSAYFNNRFTDEWLNDDFARRVITDIQGIDVMDTSMPTRILLALGGITPDILATGTKNLIVCQHFPEKFHRMSMMGDNCYKWLMELSETRDLKVITTVDLEFTEDDIRGRPIKFHDSGAIVTCQSDFDREFLRVSPLMYEYVDEEG